MKHASSLFVAAILGLASLPSAQSQVFTDPVGFIKDTIPAQSDAALTAPLTRPQAFRGVISSITGTTLTVTGTPGWTDSQFKHVANTQPTSYYIQIAKGTKAGMYAAIADNTTTSVMVQLNTGDDFTGVKTEVVDGAGQGDSVAIFPYWTPATLFPSTWPAGTQVFLYNLDTAGTNLAASQVLVYNGSTTWLDNSTFANANELLIPPTDSFVVRNPSASPLTRMNTGSVPMFKHRSLISTLPGGATQDNRIGYSSPVPEIIGQSSLGFQAGDQLLGFDNSTSGLNKAATQILVYSGTQWLDTLNNFTPVSGTFLLQPGQGYIYRTAATSGPPYNGAHNFVWQDAPSYNPLAP